MKTFRSCAMALAIVAFLSLAINARAQTPNQQTVNGTAVVVFNQTGPVNDSLNGEYATGGGSGTYGVTDPKNAQGGAGATGVGTGSDTGPVVSANNTTISAGGNAQSTISTFANGTGAKASVAISATASQATWSGTTSDPNAMTFANAGVSTAGGYTGSVDNANGTLGANGTGTSTGINSVSTINVGGVNVISMFSASGNSTGVVTASSTDPTAAQQIASVVSGDGAVNGASFAGNLTSGNFADAAANGGAAYGGSNQTGAQLLGALTLGGKTDSVVSVNPTTGQLSVSASSIISTQAQVK